MVEDIVEANNCRVTGEPLVNIWGMGDFVLSDFLEPDQPDPKAFPMILSCGEETGIVQLRHTVNPDLMYRHYYYTSGLNESMAKHLRGIAVGLREFTKLTPGTTIIDIGSNDGQFLSNFGPELTRIGFDPSDVSVIPGSHDLRINDYFSADAINGTKADIVTSIAMFYDVPDPCDFVRQVSSVMKPHGIWVVEMHYLRAMLQNNGFDAICLEHLFYYDLHAFETILNLSGTNLSVFHIEFNDVNGGSFRLYVSRGREESEIVARTRVAEASGKRIYDQVCDFVYRCADNKEKICRWLDSSALSGKKVLGYGASTKGSTIAQYFGINSHQVQAIAERNSSKIGKVTSGTRIPIISEDEARDQNPDFFLVFPYHFINAFMVREMDFLKSGGKFALPVPNLRIYP